jgi:hypothetical protein
MVRKLLTTLVARPQGDPIVIVQAPRGTFHAPWEAASAIEALRKTLPSDQLHLDIVVMDGEPTKNPKLFASSSDSSTYIRSVLSTIAVPTFMWTPKSLDW